MFIRDGPRPAKTLPLQLQQCAELAGVSLRRIQQMIAEGELPKDAGHGAGMDTVCGNTADAADEKPGGKEGGRRKKKKKKKQKKKERREGEREKKGREEKKEEKR